MAADPAAQKELIRRQQEYEQHQQERQTAQQLASEHAMRQGTAKEGYWETIGTPDITRERVEDTIEDFLATELSDKFALGNITYDDWESWGWQIENEMWVAKNEFVDADSELDDVDIATMYGDERPVLDDERARRLRGVGEVKKFMASLSVDARGLRSGTEIHAVAKTEEAPADEDEGLWTQAKNYLGG